MRPRSRAFAAIVIVLLVAGLLRMLRDPGPELEEARWLPAGHVAAGRDAVEKKRSKLAKSGPKSMDKPQDAAEFFLAQRLAPGETSLPLESLRATREEIRVREAQAALNPALNSVPGGLPSWIEIGPGNIGGRTRALVIDPDAPDIMYAGSVAGGIWKSLDGGASWNAADDLMLNLSVCALALDPANSNVLYAGTGEGFFLSNTFVRGLGIFKSVDAGATWTQLAGTVNGVPAGAFDYVNDIVVSPNDSNRVYAATRTGVWRSLDAGVTWSVVLSNPTYLSTPPTTNGCSVGCTDLALRTDTSPDTLFAAFGSVTSDGLYRTLDGGNTWEGYAVPANQGRMTLALAPSDQDVLYLLMADNGSGGSTGQLVNVFRSGDGGDTFTAQVDLGSVTGPWLLSNLILATGCIPGSTYSQGWYDNIIAVDPADPDIVWVGGVDIFRSDDGGVTFEIPGYWIFYQVFPAPPYQIHPDHHTIVFHPDYDGTTNQTMFVGNDGGLFRTTNARAATSVEDCPLPADMPLPEVVWERLNNGYGVTQFYHGDSAKDRDMFVAGAQDNGTSRVLATNTPDEWALIFGGDGGYVAIDPRNSDVLYVEYQFFPNIMKSLDGGETFMDATNGITDTDGVFITPFAMDQANPDVLWSGGNRPWRTLDGAANWELVGPNFAGPNQISAIAIAPSDSNVVYLGFTNGRVMRTSNGLVPSPTWTQVSNGLRNSWISSMAVDPRDPDVAYATYSSYGGQHIFRTTNGGQNWSSIDGLAFTGVPDIPVHWLEPRPCRPDQLFAATELGVFVSQDAGATWEPANDGLAHTVVESLDFQDENTLVAFTHGRGTFVGSLDPCRAPRFRRAVKFPAIAPPRTTDVRSRSNSLPVPTPASPQPATKPLPSSSR